MISWNFALYQVVEIYWYLKICLVDTKKFLFITNYTIIYLSWKSIVKFPFGQMYEWYYLLFISPSLHSYCSYSPIENNRGADRGKMVGSGGAERRITGGQPWGRRRNVRFISIGAHRRLRPSILLWLYCAPRRSSHHKSPVMILSGSFSGHIGEWSSSPIRPLYNLLLPTVPHDVPPARPPRFSVGSFVKGVLINKSAFTVKCSLISSHRTLEFMCF